MKIFPAQRSREEYLHTQVCRSESKFRYRKVSAADAVKYRKVLQHATRKASPAARGPVLCLGTRNGREIDVFRLQWFGDRLLRAMTRHLERRTRSFTSWLPLLESVGRSDVRSLSETSVIGAEVNPRAARRDVWVGSLDDMPAEWSGRFTVVFSNAFDQCQHPERTARDWKRVIKPGGFLIFCFSKTPSRRSPTPSAGCASQMSRRSSAAASSIFRIAAVSMAIQK